MIYILLSLIGIILTIVFVIGTHEYAHFMMARLVGVKVLRFSIGFGKTLWRRYDKKGAEYVIALVPLGGYVKMLDEREEPVAAHEVHLAYNRQPFYKKFLIVLAGPAMNLLCAAILYWFIFMFGFVSLKPVIETVTPHSIAANAGVPSKVEIVSIDNVAISGWTDILFRLLAHAGNQDHILLDVKNADAVVKSYSLDLSNWHLDGLSPDPLASIGILPYEPPAPMIIGMIASASPAVDSPLKLGDKIIAANNHPINKWSELTKLTRNNASQEMLFTIERNHQTLQLVVNIGYYHNLLFKKVGYLGIGPKIDIPPAMLVKVQYNPIMAAVKACEEVNNFTYYNLVLFGKIITGKLSLKSLGGPITIFESAGAALNYGFLPFLGFLAFLSASVGVINLLPIPGLDGGHLLFQLIEFGMRRPIPNLLMVILSYMGFALIVAVLIQALMNDVLRLY